MDNPLDVPPGGLVRCADQLHSGCAVASHRIDVLAIDLGTAQPVDHLRR